MPTFRYTARSRVGQTEQGLLEASGEDEAISLLHGRDLVIMSLQQTATGMAQTMKRPMRAIRRARGGRTNPTELITLGRSLATMIDAGLTLLKALETVRPQVQSRQLQDALDGIVQDIRAGHTFQEAVAKHPKVFSKLWVSLIETGEASGQLTKALEQITIHLEKSGAVQRKVISAMMYPSVLICVSVGAILVFVLKIIPTFGNLFANFGAELPLITRLVLMVSNVAQHYFVPVGLAMGAGIFLFWRYARTEAGRWQIDGLVLNLPIMGQLVQGAAMASFATSLGTMIKAGVPILHGLEITIASTNNVRVARVLEEMRSGAREGRSLAEPLKNSEVFPPMVAQMIAVGEETGKLAGMLDEIAKFYEEVVTTLVERMTSLLEPILLLVMGSIIGCLVVAMYLPIFQLSQTIKG